MLKLVVDANIFVSAVLKPHSDLAKIFELVREDKIKLILSKDILSEIRAVLLYPKIKKRYRRTRKEIPFSCVRSKGRFHHLRRSPS